MIAAVQKDGALLADFDAAPASADELKIWWLGQSGFLIRHEGRGLLLDPYLSDSLTAKYADTDKPHVRMTERAIAPEALADRVSVVTSSHNHTDHLDPGTLRPLFAKNPAIRFIAPEANRAMAASRAGIAEDAVIGLDDRTSVGIGGFEIHGIAAAHNERERDAAGRHLFLGCVVRSNWWTIYHSGDTLRYPGLADRLWDFPIDVAILPINGSRPERRVAGNLDGREAAKLAHDICARWVVPCHYDMFEFNTADPAELFIPECERLGQPFRVLRAGEGWSVPCGRPA